ncbi:MAG: cation transporter [Clostridia bacterium]|nr:cation transporter [Clostridia bacterium]
MISLLAKLFIRDHKKTELPNVRNAYGVLCGGMGIFLNIVLFIIKLIAGTLSGAISVTADAFNNLTDAGSSVITLIGFRMAGQKPDKDHPFGHGRIEYVSGFIVSIIIILVGFELAKTSIEKIISPERAVFNTVSALILGCSVLVKAYMAFYNFSVGKKISSSSMRATALDSLSDCVSTVVVLICLVLSLFIDVNLDAYCGLAVSAFVLFSGIRAAKETIDPLLGTPPEKEFIDEIADTVYTNGNGSILGIHDLIVHDYGPGRTMISLHAEISEEADLLQMHDLIDNIERKLREKLHCDAVIHMDPIAVHDETVSEVRESVLKIVKDIDSNLSIHDFRIVKGPSHTNLIFDVVIPFEIKNDEKAIKEKISSQIKNINENYYAVINVDNSYV